MKKYPYLHILIFFLAIIAVLPSCKKFLESNPQGYLTTDQYPKTASDALQATNATYESLREWFYHTGGYPILDIMSDDARKGSNPNDQGTTVGPYDNFQISSTQDGLDRYWNALYVGVKRANLVVEALPDISMDAALQTRYIAEARFIRGLIYFDLVRAWGPVPIITVTNPGLDVTRSADTSSVYKQIISDLRFASDNLPLRSGYLAADQGRATKGAADALLARVFLFLKNFQNAEFYAMQVINSNEYGLEPVYTDANGINGNNGVESVFEIGSLSVEDTQAGGDQYGNTQGVRGTPNKGWGFNRPSMSLRKSFEPGDPRYQGTIINLGEVIDGITIQGDGATPDFTLGPTGDTIEIECYNRKVWVPGSSTPPNWGHHRRIIRYSDVLLMAAEALNEDGKSSEALIYLNMVRARARQGNNSILPDVTTTDQNSLRDIIFNERRHELAMEGWRFWDLVRTGRAAAVLDSLGFVAGKNEILPIPQSEIDLTQGRITQNPGY